MHCCRAMLVGINGGGPETRSQYAFDYLNLPAVRPARCALRRFLRPATTLSMSTAPFSLQAICQPVATQRLTHCRLGQGGLTQAVRLRAAGVAEAQIVNEMAVQTAMLSQDRCTKNYYMYLDPATALCAHP